MKTFIEFLKNLIKPESIQENLEAYIIAGNPQDVNDVDRLEREYYSRNKSFFGTHSSFHE